ncbi:calcium-binding protein [Phenylobacterium aquaticum]|nr:calcium-binding protein [Phenylobacterium aquaticum]
MQDWVFDPQHDKAYMTTTDGDLYAFDLGSGALTDLAHLGGTLSAIDISPDGNSLLIGDQQYSALPQPAGSLTGANLDSIYLVSLDDLSTKTLTFKTEWQYEVGVSDLAFIGQNAALVTTRFAGSGRVPLRQFDPFASPFSTSEISYVGQKFTVNQSTSLIPSEDRHYVLMLWGNQSDAPMSLFDAQTDKIAAFGSMVDLGSNGTFNVGRADLNEASGLGVNDTYTDLRVFDFSFKLVKDLSNLQSAGRIVGVKFNDGGHQLLLWDAVSDTVRVFDTHSWTEVGDLQVSTVVQGADLLGNWGKMLIGDHGRQLLLETPTGFEVIDLAANLKLNVQANETGDNLYGAIGSDTLTGGRGVDLLDGGAGNDVLNGGGGHDSLLGGDGADTISGGSDGAIAYGGSGDDSISVAGGTTYLRGDEGNDSISGGSGFDDINGNAGNDTAHGNAGDDWVVGGKDNDVLYGDAGNDIVYGNLGDDTISGGDGADWVRGGQGNDSVSGGAGDDLIYGDRGNDTISGGAGADVFRSFSGAGIDRVIDFSAAEGDHVQLDPGTTYTLSQVGADTVVDMGHGDQMILVGVTLSTLPAGWIGVG